MKYKILVVIIIMALLSVYFTIKTTNHNKRIMLIETATVERHTTTEETNPIEETTYKEETTHEEKTSTVDITEYDDDANTYNVPNIDTSFKSWTNYQIVNRNSPQWNRVLCNDNAYTDDDGLRKVDEYYCVAMGSYYTQTLGDLFEIHTENGSFEVIICDFKDNSHTDANNQYTTSNGCMIEFYVDMSNLNPMVEQMGDVSYVDNKFVGEIVDVIKIGNYFD